MAVFTCFPPRLAQPQLGERQRLGGLQQDVLALAALPLHLQERGGRVESRQRRRLVAAAANAAVDARHRV